MSACSFLFVCNVFYFEVVFCSLFHGPCSFFMLPGSNCVKVCLVTLISLCIQYFTVFAIVFVGYCVYVVGLFNVLYLLLLDYISHLDYLKGYSTQKIQILL